MKPKKKIGALRTGFLALRSVCGCWRFRFRYSGTAETWGYGYDTSGRLATVTRNGAAYASYGYDTNGNRTSYTGPGGGGSVTGTYDAQDRMESYGSNTYIYTANCELASKTDDTTGQVTTYQYDVLGNLRSVTLPNGSVIEYVVDGQNRRTGRKVNGSFTHRWIWDGQLRPVAELDGAGAVVARFVYATKVNMPEYMLKGGKTYRIVTDHLGSPRFVIETATGQIEQRMDYDAFGNVLLDTNPGFTPFGFAGGLYDSQTGLVRFGARDYDPEAGRWTIKDPIRFISSSSNFYTYCSNDPLNVGDPTGMADCPDVPVAPPGASVDANIAESSSHRYNIRWFYEKVRNNKGNKRKNSWDYKQNKIAGCPASLYEDFGNFNYGATGAALGLPEWLLLRGAGWASRQADPTRKDLGSPWDWSGSFGDSSFDQDLIRAGISYYRNGCYAEDLVDVELMGLGPMSPTSLF